VKQLVLFEKTKMDRNEVLVNAYENNRYRYYVKQRT